MIKARPPRRQHILTINLEDYFQVSPLSQIIPRTHWSRFERRVERNTETTLDLLDEMGATATFFASGWIAEAAPDLIKEVARRGHEVASKGYFHRSLGEMTQAEFRDDVRHSRDALEAVLGHKIQGFRIAKGWFSPENLWALDTLIEEGFVYDSSLRLLGRRHGEPASSRFVHSRERDAGQIWEVPLTSVSMGGWHLPIAGGNYMRQLPDGFIRRAIDHWHHDYTAPLVLYFHVWELDPGQPRIEAAPWLERIRQYRNLDKMAARLRYYLQRYSFTSIARHLELAAPEATPTIAALLAAAPILTAGMVRTPITVVVPCYNEEAALPYLANTLRQFEAKVQENYALSFIFVDDGSNDKTWAQLEQLFGNRADSQLLRHEQNRGVAAATLTGIARATTEIVCAIDCDCTYDPQQLLGMIPLLTDGVALVTASPYHAQGRVSNVPRWRLFLSKNLSTLYRQVLDVQFATITSCFRVYRRSAVMSIAIRHDGFLGIAEILARLSQEGFPILEVPAVLERRLLGRSKMKTLRTIFGHLGLLASLAVERSRRKHPIRSKGTVL